ncbi:cyclophilin-like fold protein [Ochrobactrum sp. BTU1]|uniref:cyclophilin-like fold protein n=1 Tax=Ochrobactrum sp. BTU1 TaxID=2840456 RepID=UPI001C05B758|nr:MFS transporter [Ochrobactrum sp. BTU1]
MTTTSRISRRSLLSVGAASFPFPTLIAALTGKAQAQEEAAMRFRFTFANQEFTATLEDTASARELFAMLPLALKISDYGNNEKIAYLPGKLSDDGSTRINNEAVGDLCYYAPWGNLVMYYATYRWSRGLIRLGRLDGGIAPLMVRGEFPLRVERAS